MSLVASAKAFLKTLIPPIFTRQAWSKVGAQTFPSWEDASRAAGDYSAETLNNFRAKRSAGRKVDGSLLRASPLGLVARMASRPDLIVTDFGGATGDLGADFLAAFPQARFVVVENETLVGMMQGRSTVEFTRQIPASCDIFHTSTTLSYLEDPLAALAAGFDSAKQYVVLAHNSFCDVDAFHVQTSRLFSNGAGPVPEGFKDRDISSASNGARRSGHGFGQGQGIRMHLRIDEIAGTIGGYGMQLVFERVK